MTKVEKEMVLYLIYNGGANLCQKCIHLNKPTCGRYVAPDDFSGECSDDYCIEGMIKHFEQQAEKTNDAEQQLDEIKRHSPLLKEVKSGW